MSGGCPATRTETATQSAECRRVKGQTLALDLPAMTRMDSSGLNMLLTLRNRARAEHGVLHVCGVPRQALRVLGLTGTRSLFTLRPCLTP
ncbi:STAS domain-containing protein [Streptomyces xanthophaeus]|uniref:STAS domain-containing protein n=1 Tax=Streptomyces xanthophaeus TaxID=67385 RepID=UPI00341EA8BF